MKLKRDEWFIFYNAYGTPQERIDTSHSAGPKRALSHESNSELSSRHEVALYVETRARWRSRGKRVAALCTATQVPTAQAAQAATSIADGQRP